MQHAFKDTDHDQRRRHRECTLHKIQKDEAATDAAGRDQKDRPPADPVGDAADKRRRQKLAAGIAAEQQTNEFYRNARDPVRPEREEWHENAVGYRGAQKTGTCRPARHPARG